MSVEYFGNSSLFPKGFPKFPVREYGVTPPPHTHFLGMCEIPLDIANWWSYGTPDLPVDVVKDKEKKNLK